MSVSNTKVLWYAVEKEWESMGKEESTLYILSYINLFTMMILEGDSLLPMETIYEEQSSKAIYLWRDDREEERDDESFHV